MRVCVPSLQPIGPQSYPVFYVIVATPVRYVIAKRYTSQRVTSKPNSKARSGTGKYQFSLFSLFRYTSKTVSYAKELTSVYICYSEGNGFNTPLSRLLRTTVHAVLG